MLTSFTYTCSQSVTVKHQTTVTVSSTAKRHKAHRKVKLMHSHDTLTCEGQYSSELYTVTYSTVAERDSMVS